MAEIPTSQFQHYCIEIDAAVDEVIAARGSEASLSARMAQKVETSTYATDKAAIDAEIAAVANAGAKNLFNIDATPVANHTDFTLADGKLTVTANGNWAHYSVPLNLPAGNYTLSTVISGYSKASGAPDTSMRLRMSATTSGVTYIVLETITGNGSINFPFTWTGGTIYLQFYPNFNATAYANSFAAENTMIRRAEITDQTYEPYALSNPVLTPTAIKAVDEGAKSLFPNNATSQKIGGVTFTVSPDCSITANGIKENNDWFMLSTGNTIKAGTYVIYDGLPADTTDCQLIVTTGTSMGTAIMATAANARPKTVTLTSDYEGLYYAIRIASGKTVNNLTFKPMICTAQDWAVSQKIVPYCPTLYELYQMVLALQTGRSVQSAASLMRAGRIDASEQTEAELEEEADA